MMVAAGCGGASGDEGGRRADVERFIRTDLDKQLQAAGESGRVSSVTCAAETMTKFDCIVKATDGTSASAGATADAEGNVVYMVETSSPLAQIDQPEPTPEADTDVPADEEQTGDTEAATAVAEILRLEGFDAVVSTEALGPPATGQVEVALGDAQGTIYSYATAAEARAEAKPLRAVEAESPKQAKVAVEGRYVIVGTIEEPASLPVGRFNKLVDAVATLDDE